MALIMLYRTTVNPESIEELNDIRNKFSSIYRELGVEVLGHWRSVENPNESIYMVRYDSEDDYQNKTKALQENERYVHLTAKLNSIRTAFTPEKLTAA